MTDGVYHMWEVEYGRYNGWDYVLVERWYQGIGSNHYWEKDGTYNVYWVGWGWAFPLVQS